MPWVGGLELNRRPGSYCDYEQLAAEARTAARDNKEGFFVVFREREVVAWSLRNERRDVETLRDAALAVPALRAAFDGGYERFLTAIARSGHRRKVCLVEAALAGERNAGMPLTSRRILDMAGLLGEDTPIPPSGHDAFAGGSSADTASDGALPGSSAGPRPSGVPTSPGSSRSTPGLESAAGLTDDSDAGHDSDPDRERDEGHPNDAGDSAGPVTNPVRAHGGTAPDRKGAGSVRGAPGTLPPPEPRPTHRPKWKVFFRWCNARNVRPWPASAETVASFLRDRAKSCRFATLAIGHTAIAATHRSAGFGDPCASDLVKATMKELRGSAAERERTWNLWQRFHDAAALDAMREEALKPRPRGRGRESAEAAKDRGLVDIALCSLVFGVGLRYPEVAALEWRDVTIRDDGHATLKIRARGGDAEKTVVISVQTLRDIEATCDHAGPDDKIFALNNAQIGRRIKAAEAAAGLESRPVDVRLRGSPARPGASRVAGHSTPAPETSPGPPGTSAPGRDSGEVRSCFHDDGEQSSPGSSGRKGTTVPDAPPVGGTADALKRSLSRATLQVYECRWKAFCQWCNEGRLRSLPADGETVAAYLRHRAKSLHIRSVKELRSAITDAHCTRGFDDPCATEPVWAAIEDLRRARPDINLQALDAATLDAIRATVFNRRRCGSGLESAEAARHRGLVDIALCSLMYAAQLSPGQAATLKWRDVHKRGETEAWLNVAHGLTDRYRATEAVVITGQALLDLERIRNGAKPGDKVFRLCRTAIAGRLSAAGRAVRTAGEHGTGQGPAPF